jgi:hypothetical protein
VALLVDEHAAAHHLLTAARLNEALPDGGNSGGSHRGGGSGRCGQDPVFRCATVSALSQQLRWASLCMTRRTDATCCWCASRFSLLAIPPLCPLLIMSSGVSRFVLEPGRTIAIEPAARVASSSARLDSMSLQEWQPDDDASSTSGAQPAQHASAASAESAHISAVPIEARNLTSVDAIKLSCSVPAPLRAVITPASLENYSGTCMPTR